MVSAQKQNYQKMCELGRTAAASMDRGRWTLGDLACEVETHYSKDLLADFAREVNIPKARVQSYRTVSRFYEISTRYDFLDTHLNLTWTHFRIAMSAGDTQSAYDFLEECSANGFTTDEAAYHMGNRSNAANGTETAKNAPKRWQGLIVGVGGGNVTIKLKNDEYSAFEQWAKDAVEIVIQELD